MPPTIERNVQVWSQNGGVHAFERYRTRILGQGRADPVRPETERLVASGYTIVRYWFVRLARDHEIDLDVAFGFDATDDAYLPVLWPRHDLRATARRRLGPMPPAFLQALGDQSGDVSLEASFMWVDPRHVLVVVPLTIGSRQDYCVPQVRRESPDSVEDVLRAIAAFEDLSESAFAPAIALGLQREGFLGPKAIESVTTVGDATAVELWDLRGSPARDDAKVFDGAAESATFAWELAALLSHAAFHVSRLGRWRDQRLEQVCHEVSHGYTFVHDHMALVNATCCLEVCNVPADFRPRVHRRIGDWGYDSSAMFVWAIEVLRGEIARDLIAEYGERLESILPLSSLPSWQYQNLVRNLVGDTAVNDTLQQLPRYLREGRNRALSEDVAVFRGVDRDLVALAATMDKTETYGRALTQVGERRRSTRVTVLLASLAAALAAVGIPSLVDVYATWIRRGDVVEVTLATVAVVTTLAGALVLSRDGLGRTDDLA
ncbi:MAG: hypothetical protein JWQ20_1368 [Conexibacter sp.]|nr:hypothetical protein [Conexibacter sp.]